MKIQDFIIKTIFVFCFLSNFNQAYLHSAKTTTKETKPQVIIIQKEKDKPSLLTRLLTNPDLYKTLALIIIGILIKKKISETKESITAPIKEAKKKASELGHKVAEPFKNAYETVQSNIEERREESRYQAEKEAKRLEKLKHDEEIRKQKQASPGAKGFKEAISQKAGELKQKSRQLHEEKLMQRLDEIEAERTAAIRKIEQEAERSIKEKLAQEFAEKKRAEQREAGLAGFRESIISEEARIAREKELAKQMAERMEKVREESKRSNTKTIKELAAELKEERQRRIPVEPKPTTNPKIITKRSTSKSSQGLTGLLD